MEKTFEYKKFILNNGLEIYHIKTSSELFSLNIGIKVGSKFERREEKGLTHFLEHMIFKGTPKRNNIEINEDLENLAGYYNAYTSYSDTVFKVMALNEEFEDSVEIISDIIINSTFPKVEFDKEMEVIQSEIKTDYDDIECYSFLNIHRESFENSFLKWDIAGEVSDVKRYKVEDIKSFYEKYYRPNNSVIVIASSFKEKDVIEILEKFFGKWQEKKVSIPSVITEKNIKNNILLKRKEFEQSNIIYLYTFYGLTRKEEMALSIISYSLGENSNSYLFKRLREDHGMTYEVYTDMDNSDDVKTLFIYTSLARENIEKAKEIINKTVEEVKNGKLVDEKSVKLMKKILRTSIASTLLDPQHISDYVMSQVIEGRDIYEFISNLQLIDSITVEEIVEVANKVLIDPSIQTVLGDS